MSKAPIFLGALLIVCGCGGGGSSPLVATSRNYLGTQGPGDVWSWKLDSSTFTATNQTLGFHYSGSKSTLSTGFLKLQITTTDDPGVTAGQAAYAIEYPGTALILKPAGADTKPPIIASSLGTNPSGPQVTFNFVAVPSANFNQTNNDAYGHVTFSVSGNTYSGTPDSFAIDGTTLQSGLITLTGNNGLMTDNSGATGAMTPSGVCVLDNGPGNGGVIGVIQPSTNVDLADFATRHFRGFLINQGKTQCVTVTPNGDGTLHGTGYSNPSGVETGTSDGGSGVTISFTGQPSPGEVTMTIATSGGTESMVAALNRVGGKYMVFGFGVPSNNNGAPYNVVLAEN